MKCACGNEDATRIKVVWDDEGNKCREICNACGGIGSVAGSPDVYFKEPYFDEHLADDKHKHGQWVHSRRQKAEILKRLDLREAGSDPNPVLGRPAPYFSDPERRRKFYKDNYGG